MTGGGWAACSGRLRLTDTRDHGGGSDGKLLILQAEEEGDEGEAPEGQGVQGQRALPLGLHVGSQPHE